LSKELESAVGRYHSAAYFAGNSSADPANVSATTAPVVGSSHDTSDDGDDDPRLTAVYVQSRKVSSVVRPDDVRCSSPALSTSRASPSTAVGGGGSSHATPGRHRQLTAAGRTLPHDGRQQPRVSFHVTEPRSQSSTCIADPHSSRRHTELTASAAAEQHHRTSSVDDMRTCSRTPDRSPRPPHRNARSHRQHAADVSAHTTPDYATVASHDVKITRHGVTAPSMTTDTVD